MIKKTFSQVKMGALFLDGKAAKNPKYPVPDGDIPKFNGTAALLLDDAPANKPDTLITWNLLRDVPKKWSNSGVVLIADRVLLNNVSWDDLAKEGFAKGTIVTIGGRTYIAKMISAGSAINERNLWNYAMQKTTVKDAIWHWKGIGSWGENRSGMQGYYAVRGGQDAKGWFDAEGDARLPIIGFRPMLIPLDAVDPSDIESEFSVKPTADNAAKKADKPVSKDPKPEPATDFCNVFCNALCIKPNEPFSVNGKWFVIRPNGHFFRRKVTLWSQVQDVDTIAEIFNAADKISRIPDFSEADKSTSNTFVKMFGKDWVRGKIVCRTPSGTLSVENSDGFRMELNENLFPSILPGMSYPLSEIA